MQIPILDGIYVDETPEFRTSYPENLTPVPKQHGISNGFLRPSDGVETRATNFNGVSRGGVNWRGEHYRVMGTKLVKIGADGTASELGDIPGVGKVAFDYSFDYLSITNGANFYLFDGVLKQVTDPDLGLALDHIWVDGYFMTTDGEFLVVTDLNDPFAVNPLRYGSSEADPDPVVALLKLRNEPHALNRYTIEAFDNIGGSGFPFQRIDGAQIQRGVVGTHACCVFLDSIAFVGGGRNEPVSIWLASGGGTAKIAPREIDIELLSLNDRQLSEIFVEAQVYKGHQFLLVHLPTKTLVYDAAASQIIGQPVWHVRDSGTGYRARDFVWCHNAWWVGDTKEYQVGVLVDNVSTHWGADVAWSFSTPIIYNEGFGAVVHELELVCLSGRIALGQSPTIKTQYSVDGVTWSVPRFVKAGTVGSLKKRVVWIGQGSLRNWRIQRFQGDSKAHLTFARLEARVEALGV